jgi:response regulator RpfG family c-di-GMP phosphodiesterase
VNEKILFVDDEANVLSAFQRQLRKQFRIKTALGGEQALRLIDQHGPFAVVVSDMRMPEMDGVRLLAEVQRRTPDSIRVMLTGNADLQTAIDSVNEGQIFRFLTKPCPGDALTQTLRAALTQYRLITAERDLLENTLNGSIALVTDMLSMIDPDSFGRSVALRESAGSIARALAIDDPWAVELAAMLAQIGTIAIPPETLAKVRAGIPLDEREDEVVARLPEIGHGLLAHIPRLSTVAEIVLLHKKRFDGSGPPATSIAGDELPIGARILAVAADLAVLEEAGVPRHHALERMRAQRGHYDPVVLDAAAAVGLHDDDQHALSTVAEVRITDLRPGQTLMVNIETVEGRLLIAAGTRVTETIIERLRNYSHLRELREPIRVKLPRPPAGASCAA